MQEHNAGKRNHYIYFFCLLETVAFSERYFPKLIYFHKYYRLTKIITRFVFKICSIWQIYVQPLMKRFCVVRITSSYPTIVNLKYKGM